MKKPLMSACALAFLLGGMSACASVESPTTSGPAPAVSTSAPAAATPSTVATPIPSTSTSASTGPTADPTGPTADPTGSTAEPTGSRSPEPTGPSDSDSPETTKCPTGEQRGSGGSCEPCEDYEGCFTDPTQMKFFYRQIIEWVEEFSKKSYADLPEPAQWLYVPTGKTGKEGCTDGDGGQAFYTDKSYEYCGADNIVYVGEQAMWSYYQRLGDAAPAVGIAHEWGHHVQVATGLLVRDRSEIVQLENQADCVAGAWSARMVDRDIMVDDDFDDVGKLLVEIGSAEGPGRDHGTVAEREDAFVEGFKGGLKACNDFFPDRPIIR